MPQSIFFKNEYLYRFPIPIIALEVYVETASSAKDTEEIARIIFNILKIHCGIKEPDTDDFQYFVDRIQKIRTDTDEKLKEMEGKENSTKESFSSSYQKYFNEMRVDEKIMIMTGYGLERSRVIYCELDREDAMDLVDDFVKGEIERGLLALEAAWYASGGSYESAPSSSHRHEQGTNVYDIKTPQGKMALKRLGF